MEATGSKTVKISLLTQPYITISNFLKNLSKKIAKFKSIAKLRECKSQRNFLDSKLTFTFSSNVGAPKKSILDLKKSAKQNRINENKACLQSKY